MTSYRPRVVDAELQDLMGFMGAVLIDGPKAVGKTATASQLARTIFRMEADRPARAALETYPDQLFASPTPLAIENTTAAAKSVP